LTVRFTVSPIAKSIARTAVDVVFGEPGQRGARIEDVVEIGNVGTLLNAFSDESRCRIVVITRKSAHHAESGGCNPAPFRRRGGFAPLRCDLIVTYA
jgi:hypothetical protein